MRAPYKSLIPELTNEPGKEETEESADAYEMWIGASEDSTQSSLDARKQIDPALRFDLDEYFFVAS
ncbi:MAG TPA: hypothetical protein PLP17_03780 [Oligoflexia bacterium]|nr:hypothetical protein [Oligoflexia bacterium]